MVSSGRLLHSQYVAAAKDELPSVSDCRSGRSSREQKARRPLRKETCSTETRTLSPRNTLRRTGNLSPSRSKDATFENTLLDPPTICSFCSLGQSGEEGKRITTLQREGSVVLGEVIAAQLQRLQRDTVYVESPSIGQLFTFSEELFDAVSMPKTRSFRFLMSTCHRESRGTFEAKKRDAQDKRTISRDELGQNQTVEEGGKNRLLETVVPHSEFGETLLYGEERSKDARLMEKSVTATKESLPTAN